MMNFGSGFGDGFLDEVVMMADDIVYMVVQ